MLTFVLLLTSFLLVPEAAFAYRNFDARSRLFLGTVTAYTSSPTAATASGTRAFDGLLACPRKYPFGTLFAIEGRIYECRDRLSRKYDDRFDLWKPTNRAARLFGKRKLLIVALIPISRYASVIRDWLHVRLRRY
jgi:hypothetical protein